MPFLLPMTDEPDQTQRIQLGDTVYNFRLRWNPLEGAWYCYIGGVGSDPVVQFKLQNGLDLLSVWRSYENVPGGGLFVLDSEQSWGRPGRDDFGPGKRFGLIYFNPEENIL